MSDTIYLQNQLLVGGAIFGIGLIGFTVRRNLIVMFLCAEMMLQGVSLTLVAFSRYHNDFGGQMLVIFIIAVAACEAAIALALVLMLFKQVGKLDVVLWQSLREPDQNPYIDREVPEDMPEEPIWPSLTPAGREPERDEEQELYRTHV